MGFILKLFLSAGMSFTFLACAGKKPQHSTANYKRINRYPSAGEHAPLMQHSLDQNLYDACRRERSERYCKRRLGTWRQ